jgi:erythrin-vacuolar iron transport family protein
LGGGLNMKNFNTLSEREILALGISLEEEDERVYADFAEGLKRDFPASASVFDGMRGDESGHRRRLIELYRQKFGEHIPLIRRQDVKGFVQRRPVWLVRPLGLDKVRQHASAIEVETRRFYEQAAARAQDASIRQLLDDLAQEERTHEDRAQELTKLRPEVKEDEDKARRRLFVLQIVQPGLEGLMDGSVSTLAPVFAAALATRNSWDAFLVGLAASVGAGISMGFAEVRRRQPHGPRSSVVQRTGLRRHDYLGWDRTHFALRYSKLSRRNDYRVHRRTGGTRRDHLDSTSLHGHADIFGSYAGGSRRRFGVRDRYTDRQFLIKLL